MKESENVSVWEEDPKGTAGASGGGRRPRGSEGVRGEPGGAQRGAQPTGMQGCVEPQGQRGGRMKAFSAEGGMLMLNVPLSYAGEMCILNTHI